ncbi:hypothetical protein CALVIDRAFT_483258 [Calocera viscosa TUFC12733]|uniref:Exonuclease domain-containing protein n=1 Tax=Calocera viscosa (strain TUFC12733) TaxID=1330018 RepID=A0A167L221_CALVF|nr:hypothetical protein CALVIDRAFT_483258 [Calocera viscosa TUFC12733]
MSTSTLSLTPPDSPLADHRGFTFPLPPLADSKDREGKIFRRQPFDAYLVLDVEATCEEGGGFDWPNEIIEWPVVLMKWSEMDTSGRLSTLTPVAEFRSFVRPTWAPLLSPFCTSLTGITQSQIDPAPAFPEVLRRFREFLVGQGLLDERTGEPLVAYTFATDGPWDLRDFLVKQCWLSGVPLPTWVGPAVVDVRKVLRRALGCDSGKPGRERDSERDRDGDKAGKHSPGLSIPYQLQKLGLAPFEGRQHCGIDDTRNIARVLAELGQRGCVLDQNTALALGGSGRRYDWMGDGRGEVERGERWKGWAPPAGAGELPTQDDEPGLDSLALDDAPPVLFPVSQGEDRLEHHSETETELEMDTPSASLPEMGLLDLPRLPGAAPLTPIMESLPHTPMCESLPVLVSA